MKRLMSMAAALLLIITLCPQARAEGSIYDLMEGSHMDYRVDLVSYYLTEMYNAAIAGDTEAGRAAECSRNAVMDGEGSSEVRISFDDLYLLARLIQSEAGCDWLTDDFRMCVGEVVMNRVASPEYPDSIREVIYQKGQYSAVCGADFETLIPSEACVSVALRLLQGERKMVESVVFQSNTLQGELFTVYTDRRLGSTYFCVSPNQELYPIG